VSDSPLGRLLDAIDALDVEAVMALAADDIRLLVVDGRRAEGAEAVRAIMTAFLGALRSTAHRVTRQWHLDDVWIAEVEADYELHDYLQLRGLPRVFIVQTSAGRLADVRVYGAHEHPLAEHRTGEEGMWIGGRWVPPL
jgi:hypothetical protein